MSSQTDLGRIDREDRTERSLTLVRFLLPVGWVLAAVGYYGPWIWHRTAGLTLSGVDMAEFVKFLQGALDGSLSVVRQLFYLPPFVVVATIAVLIGSRRLRYPWFVQVTALICAVPVSLQLLPPAWSVGSLLTPEFRLQTLALGLCWLLLTGFWLLGRLPGWFSGGSAATLSLAAIILPVWQFAVVKPAIDEVYGRAPSIGWGVYVCAVGLAVVVVAGALFALYSRGQRRPAR